MRYLCLLYVAEDTAPAPGTPAFGEVVAANFWVSSSGRG